MIVIFFQITMSVCVWDCKTMLCLTFYSLPPGSVSLEQQSVHAKEATEDMEVAILKTCQSVNDLRREVSSSLSLFYPFAL